MQQELQKKLNSSNKEKKQLKVDKIFSKVSDKYDLMNDIMSFGLHRAWKNNFVDLIKLNNQYTLLDIATGSGDILKLITKRSKCKCIGYDPNVKMIKQARKKNRSKNISFIQGRAENIPFKNDTFDLVTVAFGVRNFTDLKLSLKEIKRIIKKGGKFYCLEFSEINNKPLRKLFKIYSKLIPLYGKLIVDNEDAYKYLIQSIKEFPNQIMFSKELIKAGFKNIEVIDILDGVASIHICEL